METDFKYDCVTKTINNQNQTHNVLPANLKHHNSHLKEEAAQILIEDLTIVDLEAKQLKGDYDDDECLNTIHTEFDLFKNSNNMKFQRLSPKQIQENHENLKNICDQNGFKAFCKNAYGYSFKTCLWLQDLNHLIVKLPKTMLETHHICPKFLTRPDFNFDHSYLDNRLILKKDFVEKDYNKIIIPYTMHAFIHALRYIEYGFKQDFAVLGMAQKYALHKQNHPKYKTRYELASFFLNHPNNTLFDLEIWKQRHLEFCQQGGIQYAENVLDETIASFLISPMTWKQDKYNLTVHYPANFFSHTRSLVKDLINRLPNQNRSNQTSDITNQMWMNYTRYMKDYLGGYKKRKTFFSQWYLVGIENNPKRCSNLKLLTNSAPAKNSKQPIDVQNMLLKGGYLWVHNNSNIPNVLITAGKFKNFQIFIKTLLDLLPAEDQPLNYQSFDNLNYVRTNITREFTKVVIISNKRKSYCGWSFVLV